MLNRTYWLPLSAALACLFVATAIFAQDAPPATEIRYCGQWMMEEAFFNAHPGAREAAEEADQRLEEETQVFEDFNRDELIIIPVVFHVIHYNGPENISDEQIYSGIEVMNRDFRKLNPDTADVITEFEDIAADSEIEFRLAQIDPNGNCHTGINRIVSPLTYVGDGDVKDLIQWPRNSYLNVWVVENANGAAGYSLYPSSVNGAMGAGNDGIVVAHDYTGNIGTSNNYRSRTLTHEAGHWMNLRHPWGNSNSPGDPENCDMDDNVDDTPLTSGWTTCNLDGETCGSLDNVQNYMDYSYCSRMFTEGQKTRMRTAALSSIAQRNQLSQASNLQATGVAGPDILCEAKFDLDRDVVCIGDGGEHGADVATGHRLQGHRRQAEASQVTDDVSETAAGAVRAGCRCVRSRGDGADSCGARRGEHRHEVIMVGHVGGLGVRVVFPRGKPFGARHRVFDRQSLHPR